LGNLPCAIHLLNISDNRKNKPLADIVKTLLGCHGNLLSCILNFQWWNYLS